jgi:biotin operon repressor
MLEGLDVKDYKSIAELLYRAERIDLWLSAREVEFALKVSKRSVWNCIEQLRDKGVTISTRGVRPNTEYKVGQ